MGKNTLSGEATQNCSVSPEKGSPVKGKICFPFRVYFFSEDFYVQENKQKVIEVVSLEKRAEKLPNIFNPLKVIKFSPG